MEQKGTSGSEINIMLCSRGGKMAAVVGHIVRMRRNAHAVVLPFVNDRIGDFFSLSVFFDFLGMGRLSGVLDGGRGTPVSLFFLPSRLYF